MYRMTQLLGSSAFAALLAAAPASADVTPQQVWDNLQAYLDGFGYAVSGTETTDGDRLTITGFALSMDLPEGEGAMGFAADEIVLTGMDDGSVSVSFPGEMPITLKVRPEDAEPVDLVVNYRQSGLGIIVSGVPDAMVYDYSADSLGLMLAELVVDGAPVGRDMVRFDIAMENVAGQSTVALGEMIGITQAMTMDSLSYDFAFSAPDVAGSGLYSGRMTDLALDGASTTPAEMGSETPSMMLAEGFEAKGGLTHSGGAMKFSVTEAGKTTSGETSTESGAFRAAMSAEAISYDISAKGVDISLSTPDFPFPVAASMAENSFNITLPVAAAETPQDMALGVTLGGFTMSDMLWNIFDPARVLPRDPATVSFDLVGTATPFVNMFDPVAMAMLEQSGGLPGEINTLTLRDLQVEALGARLSGSGDFTFDNSDPVTFEGMPAPEGAVSLNLTGGNALIERLIAMGVLSRDGAMGARMMLSMFSVPGKGVDSLQSDIVVKGDGQVLANGQRIR